MRTIRTTSAVSGLSRPSLTLALRHLGTSPTAPLFSQINVRDLAKGISAQDQPEVSSLDQNWFQYARTAFSKTKGAAGSSGGIDVAAKERIVKAQREAAMRELPAAMQRQMRTQMDQGSPRSAKGEGRSSDEADLSKYKTVKDTLDAADPYRATANGGGPSSPSSSAAGGASANRGVVNLASSLESEEITMGSKGIHEMSEAAPATPSLSIAPAYISPDAIVTPQAIRTMFMESVQARTVANTALRKYIKALNSRDYALAVAAYDGCREGGLRIDADTYAALLDLLLAAQQLKAGMELYQTMLRDRTPPNTHAYNALMRLCINREAIDTALRLFDEMPKKGRRYDKISYELAMTAISMQPHPVDWQKAVQIFEKATAGAVDANGNSFDADEEGEGANANGGAVANNSEANESITFDDKGDPIPAASGPKRARRKDLLLRSCNHSTAGIADADEGGDDADYVPCPNKQKQVGGFTAGRSRHGNMATASTYNALMKVYLSMQPFEWRVVYNCYFEMRNSKPKVPITWESYYLVAEAMRKGEASRTRRLITYIDAWIQLTSIGSARFVMGFATYALLIGVAKLFLSAYFTDRVQESQDAGVNVQKELPVGHETIAVGLAGKSTRAVL